MARSSSEEEIALPTQQVVNIGHIEPAASTCLPANLQKCLMMLLECSVLMFRCLNDSLARTLRICLPKAQRRLAMAMAQRVKAEEVKIPIVWDKSSFKLERHWLWKHVWELSGEFTAEVPCELRADFHCREVKTGTALTYQPVDHTAPPPFRIGFPTGRNTLRLAGAHAIDMNRWPLQAFWQYKQKARDIIPIVFDITTDDFQLVTHLSLEVTASKEKSTNIFGGRKACFDPVVVRQKVVVGGAEYTIEEVYGLAEACKDSVHDESVTGEPCVICLCEPRTTALTPCNHLCVCDDCAGALNARATLGGERCPICRAEVKGIKVFVLSP